jgi:glutamate synthase (NADPH/NADH) small chain
MAKPVSRRYFEFTDRARGEPQKIPLQLRRHEFREIYTPFTQADGEAQSERCIACGNP